MHHISANYKKDYIDKFLKDNLINRKNKLHIYADYL